MKLLAVRVCLWLPFCVFRGETEGVSCWRERGVEDPHPSQRNKTTVWNCERSFFFSIYILYNTCNHNLTIVNSVVETGVHWFWWEKEDKQKETDDSGGKSELFYFKCML